MSYFFESEDQRTVAANIQQPGAEPQIVQAPPIYHQTYVSGYCGGTQHNSTMEGSKNPNRMDISSGKIKANLKHFFN